MSCRYKLDGLKYLIQREISLLFSILLCITLILQVVKTGGTPKVPDCFQRTPKKLCIPEKAEILAVNVDSKGQTLYLIV